MNIRKNDTVLVISGKDRGKKGKVRRSLPGEHAVIVEGVNMAKKHTRVRTGTTQAGIVEKEMPLQISKVMLLCNKCNHPTRVGARFLEDSKKVRECRVCHEVIE